MQKDEAIAKLVQKYVDVDEATAQRISEDIARTGTASIVEGSKQRILKEIELHSVAHEVIEQEVTRFREELYLLCRTIASHEMERNIITEPHVIQARHKIWRGYHRISLTDGFLTLGSLLVGAAIPHIFEISSGGKASVWLLVVGLAGGVLLGMGLFAKAKGS